MGLIVPRRRTENLAFTEHRHISVARASEMRLSSQTSGGVEISVEKRPRKGRDPSPSLETKCSGRLSWLELTRGYPTMRKEGDHGRNYGYQMSPQMGDLLTDTFCARQTELIG